MNYKHNLLFLVAILLCGISPLLAQESVDSGQNRSNDIQRVRIDFETPMGFVRHLLLGFTPDNSATDGFDYGYDAVNIEDLPDDLNWMIDEERYVIQGVGAFHDNKAYPFGMFLTNSGNVKFSLLALENFTEPVNVYIYDSLDDSFHQINDNDYSIEMIASDYMDRFYITFSDQFSVEENLSVDDYYVNFLRLKYNRLNNQLHLNTQNKFLIENLEVFSPIGELLFALEPINESNFLMQLPQQVSNYLIFKFETSKGVFYKKLIL